MRGSALLNSTEVFFPTLARQLILNVPALHENALVLIQSHLKHGARQNLDLQAKDLFAGLLSQLPSDHPPIVIVVDAVDECTDSAQDLVCRMLYLMMDALSQIAAPLRVFVTSRPEAHIEESFQAKQFSSAQRFILHEVPRPVIDADIRLYFKSALGELPDGPRKSLFVLYPDAPDDLTDLAAGLFIYATTAVEFLKQYRSAITQGMERLVMSAREKPRTALQRLDELYTLVLQSAFPQDFLRNERDSIRAFLGHVAVLQDHISPCDLATLIGVNVEKDIQPVLERLGAVLSFEPGNLRAPMRPLHASFGEFLVDAMRCTDPNFHVNLAEQHLAVANSCLALMMRPGALVYNVCRLPDPSIPRDEIDDLSARVAKYLPAPVQYSCKHWFVHLALSGGDRGTTPQLLGFCHRRPLEWIEAAVFLDSVDRMLIWLPKLHCLDSAPGGSQEARQLLFEIWRFVLEFSPAIKTCPQQIYLSALPLLPSSSKLLETIKTRQAGSPAFSCIHGIVPEWPVWWDIQPSTLHGSGATDIQCAVLEPSERWIAVAGSQDGAIHLCHPETGNVFLTVRAHDNEPVYHLCASFNGLRLVSTSVDRVCVVSTRSGAVLNQFDNPVEAVGYFGSGNFIMNDSALLIRSIVDGENDKLQIWDLVTNIVTELPLPEPENPRDIMELPCIAVSSNGLRAIAVGQSIFSGPATTGPYSGYVLDLFSSGTAAYTLPLSGLHACFVSGDIAVVPLDGALHLFDISTQVILRTLDASPTDHWNLAASPDGAMVIGVQVPRNNAANDVIDVWDAAGRRTSIRTGCPPEGAFIRPGGGGLLAITASSWRMIDMGRATAATSSAPAGSMQLGDMEDLTDNDSRATEARSVALAISHDCSLIAYVLRGTMHILNSGGIAATSIALAMDPLNPLFVRLAFSHERRLVVAMTTRVMCLYNTADGIVLGRYEIPDGAIRELSDDARLRRFWLGPVGGGEIEGDDEEDDGDEDEGDDGDVAFSFEHVAFTPDDTAVVAIMAANPVSRDGTVTDSVALYTVLWNLRTPGPCRISVLTTDLTLMPWRTLLSKHGSKVLTEADINQNWNLRIYLSDRNGGPRSVYTIPRCDWDRQDRGENVGALEASLDDLFYLTTDGWIVETLTKRRLGWLPPSRRSYFNGSQSWVASRGRLIVTVSDSGLLTILNMSECS